MRRGALVLVAWRLGVTQARAQEPLTLEQVVASVARHYPVVEAARRKEEAAEAEVLAARGAFDPEAVEVRDARFALEAARELEQGETTRFGLGESSLLFVNLREQATGEAAVREVEALAEYFKTVATPRAALALPVGRVAGEE